MVRDNAPTSAPTSNRPEAATAGAVGLTAGTSVVGPFGWVPAGQLRVGDKILTFDNGLQPLTRVEADSLWHTKRAMPVQRRPLMVPHGTLGNAAEMLVLPDQNVLLESDAAEAMFGDPFALVSASALEGFRGVRRVRPEDRIETVRLGFAQDQLIFAALGALFHCPAQSTGAVRSSQSPRGSYRVLRPDQARALIARMSREPGFGHEPFDPQVATLANMRIVSR